VSGQAEVRQTKTENGPRPVLSSAFSHNTKKRAKKEKIQSALYASKSIALACLSCSSARPGQGPRQIAGGMGRDKHWGRAMSAVKARFTLPKAAVLAIYL